MENSTTDVLKEHTKYFEQAIGGYYDVVIKNTPKYEIYEATIYGAKLLHAHYNEFMFFDEQSHSLICVRREDIRQLLPHLKKNKDRLSVSESEAQSNE